MNRTVKDARDRMDKARENSLVNPTLDYLSTLHNEVKDWLAAIELELCRHTLDQEMEQCNICPECLDIVDHCDCG